jgi:hypothetical protein
LWNWLFFSFFLICFFIMMFTEPFLPLSIYFSILFHIAVSGVSVMSSISFNVWFDLAIYIKVSACFHWFLPFFWLSDIVYKESFFL